MKGEELPNTNFYNPEKKDKKVNLIIENLLMQLFFSNNKYTIDDMAGQR